MIIIREMSNERVISLIETALYKLPYVEAHYEQVKQAADRQQERLDYLESRIHTLKKEKSKMVTLPSSSYHYVNDRETFNSSSQSSSLPYRSSENYDP
jgi:DNA repair ATPase RecN